MAIIKADITVLMFLVQFSMLHYTTTLVESYPQQYNSRQSVRKSHNPHTFRSNSYNRRDRSSEDSIKFQNGKFLGEYEYSPNSKFLGIDYQDEERFFHKKKHNHKKHPRPHHQRPSTNSNDPCGSNRRNPEGRFFWDINIYNVYPSYHQQSAGNDCGDYQNNNQDDANDNQGNGHSRPGLQAWNLVYNLIRPGGALNPQRPAGGGGGGLGVNSNRPNLVDSSNSNNNDSGSDGDVYDPVYDDRPVNEHVANDFPTPRPFSPGEIVGSIANTVNGVIQTVTGRRPAYRRSSLYYRRRN